jgi:hypothetical protein
LRKVNHMNGAETLYNSKKPNYFPMIHQNLPNSILQWITVSKTIYHHALKSAKQDF